MENLPPPPPDLLHSDDDENIIRAATQPKVYTEDDITNPIYNDAKNFNNSYFVINRSIKLYYSDILFPRIIKH